VTPDDGVDVVGNVAVILIPKRELKNKKKKYKNEKKLRTHWGRDTTGR